MSDPQAGCTIPRIVGQNRQGLWEIGWVEQCSDPWRVGSVSIRTKDRALAGQRLREFLEGVCDE
jgi:hypothetical protein